MAVLERGTIKIVWVTRSTKRIHSRMFDSLDPALRFGASKKHFIAFKLLRRQGMRSFSWKLLPYGEASLYELGLRFYFRHRRNVRLLAALLRR